MRYEHFKKNEVVGRSTISYWYELVLGRLVTIHPHTPGTSVQIDSTCPKYLA